MKRAEPPIDPNPMGDRKSSRQNPVPRLSDIEELPLEGILKHLNRVTAAGRLKAARDPVTRMYLRAGLRLLEGEVRGSPTPDACEAPPPFLRWLSRARVAAETRNEPRGSRLPRQGTEAGMRDRWEPHSDFIADLLLVALTSGRRIAECGEGQDCVGALASTEDLPEALQELCRRELSTLERSSGFRIRLLASALSDSAESVREPLGSAYEATDARRSQACADALATQGTPLRPGFGPEILAILFTAMAEGLALRAASGTLSAGLDAAQRSGLLGLGVLALLAGSLDPTESGITAAEYVRRSRRATTPAQAEVLG